MAALGAEENASVVRALDDLCQAVRSGLRSVESAASRPRDALGLPCQPPSNHSQLNAGPAERGGGEDDAVTSAGGAESEFTDDLGSTMMGTRN